MQKKTIMKIILGIAAAIAAIILAIFLEKHFFQTESQRQMAYDGTEQYLVFDKSHAAVGEELTVSLQNMNGTITECLWYIEGRLVSNTTSYTPKEDDLEKVIKVTANVKKTTGDTETVKNYMYCSRLPVVSINIDYAIGENYLPGSISFSGSQDYADDESELYQGNVEIKLRGNSTKNRPKQPYKIKLDAATNLYGMGANKHWVLLANDIDHTHIRNMLVHDFAAELGMDSVMSSIPVSLVMNGEYVGVYQLCEHIRIDAGRVEIFDWEALAEDAAKEIVKLEYGHAVANNANTAELEDTMKDALTKDYSWITEPYEFVYGEKTYTMTDYVEIPAATGGFLLEMDFYHLGLDIESQITTAFSQPFYFSKPDNLATNSILREYAAKYIQSFEYALHSDDYVFRNSDTHYTGRAAGKDWETGGWHTASTKTEYTDDANDGKHYTEMFDMESLIQNFFVCEFSMNWDSMKNSVFITKDIDGLAKIGPIWDYDWAFGNDNMYWIWTYEPESWHTTNEYFTNEQYYQSVQWNRYLAKDPYFLLQIYEQYEEVSALMHQMTAEGGTIDQYVELLYEAGLANDDVWSRTYREYGGKEYEEATDALREFIEIRTAWLDEQFEDFETLRKSIGYYEISDKLEVTGAEWSGDTVTLTATVSDDRMKKVSFQVNGTWMESSAVENGVATITVPAEALAEAEHNMVQVRGTDAEGNYIRSGRETEDPDSVDPYSNYLIF